MITNLYWRVLVSKEMRRCVWLVGGGGLLSFSRCIRERHTKKSRRKRYVSFVLPSDRHMQRRVVAEEVIAFGRRHRHAHCRTTYSLYTQPAHHLLTKHASIQRLLNRYLCGERQLLQVEWCHSSRSYVCIAQSKQREAIGEGPRQLFAFFQAAVSDLHTNNCCIPTTAPANHVPDVVKNLNNEPHVNWFVT